jgi:NAD(P)-dependent dehydrogenase (short-subunit alcohol dehydrogenase family)
MGVTCDVAEEAEAVAMVERTIATYGRLDMAFNNAGIVGFTGDPADESAASFDRVTAIKSARDLDVHEARAATPRPASERR